MKKLVFLFLSLLTAGSLFQACDNSKTYAEMLEDEKNAVNKFIKDSAINVISLEEFERDTITDLSRNEYVAFSNGVYMQIVDRGNEDDPEDTFANNNVICARYLEKNIASNELTCFNVVLPEYINASDYYRSPLTFRYVNENSSAYGIVLSTPLDYDYLWTANSYGTAIPGGWLLALPYLRDNAHVRLIIPSKMGHSISQQNVIPYYYDIWKFDPTAEVAPVNLTVNGRKEQLSYRLIRLDKEEKFIDITKSQLLQVFNEKTKGSGYYSAHLSAPKAPKALLTGNFMLKTPVKAKYSDAVIYTSETFEQYPNIRLSDLSFKKSIQLTHGEEQQANLNWGTAELVSWISLDGTPLEGVVYKPENFDPNKKYPVIVNFYERNSETLYAYHMPEPHRSTIDYHFYTSNGYIIFNPDVRYVDGYPGESCFNCVMPGITSLIAKGYVNEKAIGAQGHSWGGYQVAYLATRTNLFAAIESGAPVVNMFSAYGGIRWGSGLNRSFQYEHGQSRIGGTLWDSPLQYMENSPLFTMDKVETPILIMHNDNDGHVPWYQGIEYFVALKRLQKPVWLLNYTGEIHWPMRLANRIDFQKRMYQFFQHYLNKQPMPKWMDEGVPAVDQEFELGY